MKNNWKASGGPVKNQDLWERMYELGQALTIKWSWVKGHSGIEGNERADVLASTAAAQSQAQDKNGPSSVPHSTPTINKSSKPAHKSKSNDGNEHGKVYLNVPFADKEHAKKLGARWDPQKKQWYCPAQQQNLLSAGWDSQLRLQQSFVGDGITPAKAKAACSELDARRSLAALVFGQAHQFGDAVGVLCIDHLSCQP